MPTQRIVWTALPNGSAGAGTLALSVYLAPQLSGGATLALFPDFTDWPTTLAKLRFAVTVAGVRVEVTPKLTVDNALWKAFFPSTMTIKSFTPPTLEQLKNVKFTSYPLLSVAAHLTDLHEALLSPVVGIGGQYTLPDADQVAKKLFEYSPPSMATKLPTGYQALTNELGARDSGTARAALNKQRAALPKNAPRSQRRALDMTEVRLFSTRSRKAPQTRITDSFARVEFEKPLEVHDVLTLLNEYPALLNKLGLTLDLVVPFTGTIGSNASVSVAPLWPAGASTVTRQDVSPQTQLQMGAFYARSNDGSIDKGFLKVGDEHLFGTTQLDTDAGAAQLHAAADHFVQYLPMTMAPKVTFGFLGNQPTAEPIPPMEVDDTPQVGLPVLRTAGLTLARAGRAEQLQGALVRAAAHAVAIAENRPPSLYAEDIMRGWRADVRQISNGKPGPWFSLCRRDGKYTIRGQAEALNLTDEGFVRSVTVEQEGHDTLHAHEALFQWHGWSLCVPRPGQPIPDSTSQKSALTPTWALTDVQFTAPGKSLLPLRFGRTYQMRVRTADLAGHGPAPESTDTSSLTPPEAFLRFDPVPPPVLLLRANPLPGESTERLVIQSVDEKSVGAKPSVRHVAPPRTTVELAERHGMFDAPTGGMRPETYSWLADYQGKFPDVAVPNPMDPANPIHYLLVASDTPVKTPYLADPLAQAGAVSGLPSGVGTEIISFAEPGKGWPERRSFRLQLEEGPKGSVLKDGVLTVHLPKAETLKLTLSSVPTEGKRLDELAQWVSLKGNPRGQNALVLYGTAMHGGNWQLTPWRELTLVHAVQKPLLSPDFKSCSGGRRPLGGTATELSRFRFACDGKSTEQVEVVASWEEVTDLGVVPQPGGRPAPAGRASTSGRLATPSSMSGFLVSLRFKNGKIPEKGWTPLRDPDGYQRTQYDPTGKEVLRGTPTPGDGIVKKGPVLTLPDTKYRRVTLTPVATTRFREYFAPNITKDPKNITRLGAPAVIDVLNSARPDSPEVVSVVPIFKWERSKDKSSRLAGLRVYLKRGWFSSGDGEQLALVLAPSAVAANQADTYASYITQWGSDPIWADEAKLSRFVRLNDLRPARKVGFARTAPGKTNLALSEAPQPFLVQANQPIPGDRMEEADFKTTGLTLAESPLLVDIKAYDVDFDVEKDLWFADIPLASRAYTPFIRLALARYQPRSMDNAHLSQVVITDFAQILPERTVSLTRGGPRIAISITGPAPQSSESTKHVMTAQLQKKTGPSDLDWENVQTAISLDYANGTWSGSLPVLPAQRVLIQEVELIGNNGRIVFAETLVL